MRSFGLAIALGVWMASLYACDKNTKNPNPGPGANTGRLASEDAGSAKTNVEELGMLVNVPYEPDDLVWKEDAARKRLTAVLHLSKADADKIVADATPRQAPQNVTIPSESWFPAELIAQSEMSGDDGLNGTAYAADAFFMEPYTSGRLVRVTGTDYFVLQLTAK